MTNIQFPAASRSDLANWPVLTQKGVPVNSVAISGDGQKVVAGTYYYPPQSGAPFGMHAYDGDGNLLWQHLHSLAANDNGFYWVALSRDGKWAAGGGGPHGNPPSGVGYIFAYDVLHGIETTVPTNIVGGINIVALSDDGSYLVAGADAAYVFERRTSEFVPLVKVSDHVAPNGRVTAVGISNDGSIVYGTDPNNRTQDPGWVVVEALPGTKFAPMKIAWPLPTALNERQQVHQNQHVTSVAMADSGRTFAVLATTANPSVCNLYFFALKDLVASTLQPAWSQALSGCNFGGLSVAVSDDGSFVSAVGNVQGADGSVSGSVFLFNGESGAPIWQMPTRQGPNSVSVDATGKHVAVADGFKAAGSFYLFDSLGRALALPGLQPNQPGVVTWSIKISADGTAVAAGTDDGHVHYFATPTAGWAAVAPRPVAKSVASP